MGKNIIGYPISSLSVVEMADGTYTARSYLLMKQHVANVMYLMTEGTFLNDSKLLFGKPSEYVLSLRYYPIKWDELLNIATPLDRLEQIKFGGKQYNTVVGLPLAPSKEYTFIYDAGYIEFSHKYSNFIDYMAKIKIFVPYFNAKEIDAQLVIDKVVGFYFAFDLINGIMTVYYVVYADVQDYQNGADGVLIYNESVQFGIDIPFGSTNANDIAKNIYTNIFDIGFGAMKGIAGYNAGDSKMMMKGVGEVYGGLKSVFNNQERFSSGGSPRGSYNNLHSPDSIYVEMRYPNVLPIDANWLHINGKPLHDTVTLSSLTGYTEVGEIEFNSNGADIYSDEVDEIISLLKNGVIL